ncbi:MAG: AAA family ATPase [Planctomycetes bacterium]|nr:AAA family ATPase [Planctomycetota bacterium]
MSESAEQSALDLLSQLKGLAPRSKSGEEPVSSYEELDFDFSDLSASEAPAGEPAGDAETQSAGPSAPPSPASDEPPLNDPRLAQLFERVNQLLSDPTLDSDEPFRPKAPETLEETGLTFEEVERLVLKFLHSKGSATGRQVCAQVRLPFRIVESILKQLKREQLVVLRGAAAAGDYEFTLTESGRDRAKRFSEECTYFGAAPVCLKEYLKAMEAQSIARQTVSEEALREAFSDLVISDELLDRLGPAISSGRGLFLFGEPGNGKTSIAERVMQAFGSTIWIPRALGIDGDIIRLYDPGVHEAVEEHTKDGIFDLSDVDQRWVKIIRPTVVAGGELTMSQLEVTQNLQTKICEAPLQLKSNCGALVIDDFGRQRMPVDELLNRWIVPLEKRYDFLGLPSGKKIQVPFDQLIIFSTNLEPRKLVDAAFLRRIPYKIHVGSPTEKQFHQIFEMVAPTLGFEYDKEAVNYLIDKHYHQAKRSLRACHPRDLLLQIKSYCNYKGLPRKMLPEYFDWAVENYFSVM